MAMADPGANGDFSVFVGDLGPEVDDAMLEHSFRTYYTSTRTAKVMLDATTQRSRGYGFVRFSSEQERDRAVAEMNGVYLGSRPIRVSVATAKRPPGSMPTPGSTPLPNSAGGASNASSSTAGQPDESANTTLFVGGLSPSVSEAELHAAFARFGEIVYTKIPQGKGCGFVQFLNRQGAEYALAEMNGYTMGGQAIRISWGKSTGKAPSGERPTPAHHSYGHAPAPYYPPYGMEYAAYAAGYPGSGYAPDPYAAGYGYVPVDPYMAAYPGYGMMQAMGPAATNYAAMAAAGAASAAAMMHGPGVARPVLYDPLAQVNYDKMNMAYMHRQLPVMTGQYMRMPVPMPMMAHHIPTSTA